jgi:hypothetical protein
LRLISPQIGLLCQAPKILTSPSNSHMIGLQGPGKFGWLQWGAIRIKGGNYVSKNQ